MDKNFKNAPVIDMNKTENKAKILLIKLLKGGGEVLWLTIKTLVMFFVGYVIWNIKKTPEVMENVTPRPNHRN